MDKQYSDRIYKLFKSQINKLSLYEFESNKKIKINNNLIKTQNESIPYSYSINSCGFRTQEFKKYSKNSLKILFAGCSNTFGEGLPLEYTWSQLLIQKIFQKKIN